MPFLPDHMRDGEIKFKLAKFMPYRVRLATIFLLLAVGFGVQSFGGMIYTGAPFLLAAAFLSLVSGYDARPPKKSSANAWRPVTVSELTRIIRLEKRNKSWDQSLFDITCVRGAVTLLLIIGTVFLARGYLLSRSAANTANMLVGDAVILILPHYVTGVRRILTNPGLVVKTQIFLELAEYFKKIRKENESLEYMLNTRTTEKGDVPADVRVMIKLSGAPEAFLGLQAQVSLNNVQGKDYPYFYCVLVTQKGFGLKDKLTTKAPSGMTLEKTREADVEVAVLRQYTTKTSGYYTKAKRQREIFTQALQMAREVAQS